jgi:hypothetical protein
MSVSELVTLRFQSGGAFSGEPKRAVKKGVYWTDKDEAVYQGLAAQLEFIDKMPREDAEREALEFAITNACGRALQAAFRRAEKCLTAADKRALHAEWVYFHGKPAADRIAAGFKNEAERRRVLDGDYQ